MLQHPNWITPMKGLQIFVSWLVIISFYRSNTTLHTSNLLSASYLLRKAGHCFNLNFIACCTTQIRPDSHLISEPESSIGQEPMNMWWNSKWQKRDRKEWRIGERDWINRKKERRGEMDNETAGQTESGEMKGIDRESVNGNSNDRGIRRWAITQIRGRRG